MTKGAGRMRPAPLASAYRYGGMRRPAGADPAVGDIPATGARKS